MSRIRLTEASMAYGDVCGNPIDFERDKRHQHITFNYDCTSIMTQKNRDEMNREEIDQKKIPHDTIKFDYKPRGASFFDFTWKRFCYELKKDGKGIQDIKLVYLNLDNKEEVLLDTSEGKDLKEKIEFEDGEIISQCNAYVEEVKGDKSTDGMKSVLCGLDITTNKGKNVMIGERKSEGLFQVLRQDQNKVIVGLGCFANKEDGVTAIYFHLTDTLTYAINETYGIRQLRAKIKKNQEFAKGLEALKPKLSPEQNLLSEVCNLPDAVFFSIIKYVMPY
jgi:hypothetical protein